MSSRKRALGMEVKVTDRCNQECPHCMNGDGRRPGRDLDWRLFNRRLEEWAGRRGDSVCDLREVRLTGGEPLVDIDAVLGIAECCRRLGLPVGINTNGLLLDPDRIRRLKQVGIGVVKVSFDAIDAATYGLMRAPLPSLDPLVESIRTLAAEGFRVIMRFTLSRTNRDHLVPCRVLAGELGVHTFQIKPLIRSGRAVGLDTFLDAADINAALGELARRCSGSRPVTEVLCWPPAAGLGFTHTVCGGVNKIYVAPSMAATTCNFIPGERRAQLGDLASTPLEDLLRRRLERTWTEQVEGHSLLAGCPNAPGFRTSLGAAGCP